MTTQEAIAQALLALRRDALRAAREGKLERMTDDYAAMAQLRALDEVLAAERSITSTNP